VEGGGVVAAIGFAAFEGLVEGVGGTVVLEAASFRGDVEVTAKAGEALQVCGGSVGTRLRCRSSGPGRSPSDKSEVRVEAGGDDSRSISELTL